jgi:hypothetical protein
MPTDLIDLDLDEVSLVGEPANGKKFLIYKSMESGNNMANTPEEDKKDKPGGTPGTAVAENTVPEPTTSAAPSLVDKSTPAPLIDKVTKADLEKAVAEERARFEAREAALRKELEMEKDIRRKHELIEVAKSEYPALGKPEDTAQVLKQIEDSNLPEKARAQVLASLKQASAIKAEAGRIITKELGHNRTMPGSDTALGKFYAKVEERIGEIRKSAEGSGKARQALKSMAVRQISLEYPDLARDALDEERKLV